MKKINLSVIIFSFCSLFANAQTATTDNGVVIDDVKWATRNVDKPGTFAANPWDFGMVYQWNSIAAWNTTGSHAIDGSNWIKKWDSAHIVPWQTINDVCPAGWRLPTREELFTLEEVDDSRWTTINSVGGFVFTSGKNTLFLPAGGYRDRHSGVLSNVNENGCYWGSTLENETVYSLYFDTTSDLQLVNAYLTNGFCIRCVAK